MSILNIGRYCLQNQKASIENRKPKNEEVKYLEIAINELTVKCEKLRQDFQEGNSMGNLECRLF